MTTAEIGSLAVSITLGTGNFDKNVKGVEQTVARLGAVMNTFAATQVKAAGAALTQFAARLAPVAIAALAAQRAVALLTSSIADISAMDRLSQATGISITTLDGLRRAAEETGVEFNTLQQVVSQFGTRMTQAISSPTSETAIALRAIGLEVRNADGSFRSLIDILPDLADRISQFGDGMNKTAILSRILGEQGGPELARLLNQGGDAVRAQIANYERQSTLSDEAVRNNRQLEAANRQLQAAVSDLGREFGALLAPSVTAAARAVAEFFRRLREGADSNSATEIERQITALTSRVEMLQRHAASPYRFLPGYTASRTREIADLNEQIALLQTRLAALRNQEQNGTSGAAGKGLPPAPAIDTAALERIRQQLDATRDRLGGTQQSLMFSYLYGSSTPTAITNEFVAAMAAVDEAVRRGAITAEQATRQKRDLALQEQGYILDTASMAATTLTAVFAKNKAAASAAAGINTAVAITRALQLPWPFNWIQAGLVAASGAAQIASINSASEKGGGSVSPVSGGGDSGGGAAAPPDAGRALHITGVDRASLYSGDALQGIIEGINDAVQNGYTLISTRNMRQ